MVFTIAVIVGFVVLVASLVFDGVFEVFDADFGGSGLFSTASVGGFITGFGLGGWLGRALGLPPVFASIVGRLLGGAIGWVAVLFYRWLKRNELSPQALSTSRIVGTPGVVTAGTAAPGEQGLVRVTYLGAPRTMSFVADSPIPSGAEVTVTEVMSDNVLKVLDFR
ncbi:MAG: hypothetical protein LBM23_06060 [Propionibacteriaceae bacterium]|jgi:hypothetical protein|nr:hypothetical protein [Propionibacteriaceae bacterium]